MGFFLGGQVHVSSLDISGIYKFKATPERGIIVKYAVVTGTSRGLGRSIAMFFLEAGIHVYGLSRNKTDELATKADENHVTYRDYVCDLSDINQIETTIEQMAHDIYGNNPEAVYLVNNAAMLEPIAKAVDQSPEQISKHIQVNITAPMVLTNQFLKKGSETDIPLIGMMITSGAANRPVYGWSAYCSSKAALNMYVKTVALEQDHLGTSHRVIAFNPGVMDTEMQEKIRASSEESFKDVNTFRAYKEDNRLSEADMVASIIVDIMGDEATIENGKIYDISDYK